MKIIRTIIPALCALMLFSCTGNASKENVFEYDEFGVATRINPDEKCVWLVFTAHYSLDDNGYFENFDGVMPVLNTLKEKEVNGSFFPTGVCLEVEKYQEAVRRIIDEGHYLSSHSFNHLLLCEEGRTLVSADSIKADFALMESSLEKYGLEKEHYDWLIPPYETYNQETADVMRDLGYKLINPTPGFKTGMDWTSPGAPNYISTDEILEGIWQYESENTLNGVILLIHAMNYPDRTDEDRPYTYLGEIIDTLRSKGYTFKTMFDL